MYTRRERDSEFGKMIPPHQRKKAKQKKKDKGSLFFLDGVKKVKGNLGAKESSPTISFSLFLGIFSSSPLRRCAFSPVGKFSHLFRSRKDLAQDFFKQRFGFGGQCSLNTCLC